MNVHIALLCGLLAAAATVRADPAGTLQPLETIRAAALGFATEAAGGESQETAVAAAALDPRLRLAACGNPIAPFLPPGSRMQGNVAIGVRCEGPVAWTVYVPVTVNRQPLVAVLARPMQRGEVVTADALSWERRPESVLFGGWYAPQTPPVGQVLRRALGAGTALSPQHLEQRILVRRGAQVVLAARLNGVSVRISGTALGDGRSGARVRVKNPLSNRIVEGIVSGDGTVMVAL
ncbi:MAG: flagellar basal body P-ring formation chaperone FlgA [Gammaproteobacteria bacterium]